MESLDLTEFGVELSGDSQKQSSEVLASALSECGIAKSGLDLNCSEGLLAGPLLVEVREYEDITQPKQRFEDDKSREVDPDDFKKINRKGFKTFFLTAFDGIRDVKIALIMEDKGPLGILRKPILKDSKYLITNAPYINKIVMIREDSQIKCVYEGSGEQVFEKREKEMTGLAAEETAAPKFVEL